jgi:elongator complex protein 4
LCSDLHSAYGELVQKYFVAQGLACGQNVCIIDDDAREFVKDCMWIPGNTVATATALSNSNVSGGEVKKSEQPDDKIKIAWRYERMKQFQTTVPSSASYVRFLQ